MSEEFFQGDKYKLPIYSSHVVASGIMKLVGTAIVQSILQGGPSLTISRLAQTVLESLIITDLMFSGLAREYTFKMAARLSADEVRQLVLCDDSDDEDDGQSIESLGDADEDEEKLSNLMHSFDGGENFDKSFFKENAIRVLLPIILAAKRSQDLEEEPQRYKGIRMLSLFFI